MVAYHFPPLAGSSGIQRTLRFVQHLPRFGWQPTVLTADVRADEHKTYRCHYPAAPHHPGYEARVAALDPAVDPIEGAV